MFKYLFYNISLYTLKIIHFVFIFNLFYINWFSSFSRRAFVVTQPSSIYCYLKLFVEACIKACYMLLCCRLGGQQRHCSYGSNVRCCVAW